MRQQSYNLQLISQETEENAEKPKHIGLQPNKQGSHAPGYNARSRELQHMKNMGLDTSLIYRSLGSPDLLPKIAFTGEAVFAGLRVTTNRSTNRQTQ